MTEGDHAATPWIQGRLYLSGVSAETHAQLERSRKLALEDSVRARKATAVVWHSAGEAVADARRWLQSQS